MIIRLISKNHYICIQDSHLVPPAISSGFVLGAGSYSVGDVAKYPGQELPNTQVFLW